jgi:hypothetical protein
MPMPASKAGWRALGKPCTDDCSGHEAGWYWAERVGLTDPARCNGTTNSFIEGCQACAEEALGQLQAAARGMFRAGGGRVRGMK